MTRTTRIVAAVLLLAAAAWAAWAGADALRFELAFRAAEAALADDRPEDAGASLADCLKLDPKSGRANFLAARAARLTGQLDFARDRLAAAADVKWPAAAVALEEALMRYQSGEFAPSDEDYLRASLSSDVADRPLILAAAARGMMKNYRLLRALDLLDARLAAGDSVSARIDRAWVLERLDRQTDAEAEYRAILERRPTHRVARLRLSAVLRQQKRPADAVPFVAELHRVSPNDAAAALELAECRLACGEYDAAKPLLDELLAKSPKDADVLMARGKLALAEGDDAKALESLRHAASLAPQSYEAQYQYLLCLKRRGDAEEAGHVEKRMNAVGADLKRLSELTEALQTRPRDPAIRVEVAEIFLRRGESAQGVAWLKGVLRDAPGHPAAHRALAGHYEKIGEAGKAREHRAAAKE